VSIPETSAFTDTIGREWRLSITVASIERVAAATSIRLDRLLDDGCKPLADLLGNLPVFVNVLWHLCQKRAAELKLTPDGFAEGFAGDVLDTAALAFQRALADFSPSRARQLLLSLATKGIEVQDRATTLALERIAAANVDEVLSTLSGSATSLPESAE